MLYGIANLGLCSNNLTATNSVRGFNIFADLCIAGFTMDGSSNQATAMCWRGGKKQQIASQVTEETYTITLNIEAGTWAAMQVGYGVLATQGALRLPTTVEYKVPATGGLTITQTDISTANANASSVRVFDQTKDIFLVPAATTPGVNEFSVAPATGVITLNASQQNSNVYYIYDKVYSNAESIGLNGSDDLTEFSLAGRLSSTIFGSGNNGTSGVGIFVPRLAPISIPSLALEGDKAIISIQYQALLAPGYKKPFQLVKLDTATV